MGVDAIVVEAGICSLSCSESYRKLAKGRFCVEAIENGYVGYCDTGGDRFSEY
jgi:hypothetical protein